MAFWPQCVLQDLQEQPCDSGCGPTRRVSRSEHEGTEGLSHVCISVSDTESTLSKDDLRHSLCKLHHCIPVLLGCLKDCAVQTMLCSVLVTCIWGLL